MKTLPNFPRLAVAPTDAALVYNPDARPMKGADDYSGGAVARVSGFGCQDEAEQHRLARLFSKAPAMVGALHLAEQYLRHPDVQAIPFALSAAAPLRVVRDVIAAATGGQAGAESIRAPLPLLAAVEAWQKWKGESYHSQAERDLRQAMTDAQIAPADSATLAAALRACKRLAWRQDDAGAVDESLPDSLCDRADMIAATVDSALSGAPAPAAESAVAMLRRAVNAFPGIDDGASVDYADVSAWFARFVGAARTQLRLIDGGSAAPGDPADADPRFSIMPPGLWENADGPAKWFAILDEVGGGIVVYTATESLAERVTALLRRQDGGDVVAAPTDGGAS